LVIYKKAWKKSRQFLAGRYRRIFSLAGRLVAHGSLVGVEGGIVLPWMKEVR